MRIRFVQMFVVVGLVTAAAVLFHACTGGGHSKVRTTDNQGRPTATLQTYDSLLVSLEGAEPKAHYDFIVFASGSTAPVLAQAKLVSDREGDIPPSLLVIDVDPAQVPPGAYELWVSGPKVEETLIIDIEDPTEPYIFSCNVLGEIQNSYALGVPVWGAGGNFAPHAEVRLGVMYDRRTYEEGDVYTGMFNTNGMGPQYITVYADANGDIPITQVPAHSAFIIEPGQGFDLVADLAPFGEYTAGADAVDGHAVVGLTYQTDDVGSDVDAELACNADGVYKETFSTEDDIYAWINPPLQYAMDPRGLVSKYVVDHKDEWANGDPLVDVSGGDEMDGVQQGCTNEGIVLVFPGPLPPGQYDVIMDVDQDGLYTQGLDIVDGGSAESFGKVGFTVE